MSNLSDCGLMASLDICYLSYVQQERATTVQACAKPLLPALVSPPVPQYATQNKDFGHTPGNMVAPTTP